MAVQQLDALPFDTIFKGLRGLSLAGLPRTAHTKEVQTIHPERSAFAF